MASASSLRSVVRGSGSPRGPWAADAWQLNGWRCSASSSRAVRFASSSARPMPTPVSQERTLIAAKPQVDARSDALDDALVNSHQRRGAFGERERRRMDVLQEERMAILERQRQSPGEKKRLERKVVELIEASKKGKTAAGEEELLQARKKAADAGRATKEDRTRFESLQSESSQIRLSIPNFTHPDAPIGSEQQAQILEFGGDMDLLPSSLRPWTEKRFVGLPLSEVPELDNASPDADRDHLNVAEKLGWVDVHASNLVTGPSWPFLLGPLATLEHALVSYAMDCGARAGFTPVVVPDAVRRDIVARMGFAPREREAGQVYWIQTDGKGQSDNPDAEGNQLGLAATAEITLGGLCAGRTYAPTQLPIRLLATSHAFRAEAGSRGLESRGLYRVHQFTKVEMFVVCSAAESDAWLERLRGMQQSILAPLRIPYRVLDMPTEELGASSYRKYDVEAWMPGRGGWGEISSTSNCTDFQSRRLRIRVQNGADHDWPHTLNGTAIAVPRLIVALLENYGVTSTDQLRLPVVLRKHWLSSDVDNVEWIGKEETPRRRRRFLKRSIERVQELAQRSGTDPASMVVSFLVLHELTAIVPLILLFYLLGLLGAGEAVMQWLLDASTVDRPTNLLGNDVGGGDGEIVVGARHWLQEYIEEGVQRAERYGRRKGYFGFEQGSGSKTDVDPSVDVHATPKAQGLAGTFANAVAAYALVKILLPARLAASVALAGPFARLCIEPLKRVARRFNRRRA